MEIGIFICLSDVTVRKLKGFFFLTLLENEALGEILLHEKISLTDAGGKEKKIKGASKCLFFKLASDLKGGVLPLSLQ